MLARGRSGSAVMSVLAVCLICGVGQGATIFVKADAAGANNGASWADAFKELQSALAVAVSGDQIWVAAGVIGRTETRHIPREAVIAPRHFGCWTGWASTGGSQDNPDRRATSRCEHRPCM